VCVIVDTNLASQVLLDANNVVYAPVRKKLFENKRPIRLVYGGRLAQEYSKNRELVSTLLILDRAARTFRINDEEVRVETRKVVKMGLCRSNDAHIIALARISKARVLISADGNLETDFKNAKLIAGPRGKIYKQPSHQRLLRQCES
jgi:hypothetical protein